MRKSILEKLFSEMLVTAVVANIIAVNVTAILNILLKLSIPYLSSRRLNLL